MGAETKPEKVVLQRSLVEKSSVIIPPRPKDKHEPHRSRAKIIFDVLLFLHNSGEVVKTHVMYGANLSFEQYKGLLKHLKKKRLVTIRQEGRKTYIQLTNKGEKALELGREFLALTGEL